MPQLKSNPNTKKRTKPDKIKAEKYIKDKHAIKTHTMKGNETVLEFVARVHGVSMDELKSCGVVV